MAFSHQKRLYPFRLELQKMRRFGGNSSSGGVTRRVELGKAYFELEVDVTSAG